MITTILICYLNRILFTKYPFGNQKSHVVEENVYVSPYAVPNALHAADDVGAKLGEDLKDAQLLFVQLEERGEDFGKLFKDEFHLALLHPYIARNLLYPINVNTMLIFDTYTVKYYCYISRVL